MTKTYEKLMKECLKLAKKANGANFPNPFVGAIVFDEKENKIISKGYHKKYGEAHAEVNAIKAANGNTQNKTIIVNLEPCSHYGKTPPCADLIIKSGFKKVVVGLIDPNPKVKGQGIKRLKDAGIEVITGVLEEECKKINKIFLKNILSKKPYVMLKTAVTLDSKIATKTKKSKWITNELARLEVQKLRSEYQAIMSASGTILEDNPRLNVRMKNKKSPIRIIFDPNNKIPLGYNVFNDDGVRKILINNSKVEKKPYIEQISFKDFNSLFEELYKMGIYSIMIEAGQGFNSILLKEKMVDELNIFYSNKIFGNGLNFVDNLETDEIPEAIELEDINIKQLNNNFLINGKIKTKG